MTDLPSSELDRYLLRLRAISYSTGRARDIRAAKHLLRRLKLIARAADPYFPSLFGAAGGKLHQVGVRSSGRRLPHAWWWGSALTEEPWVLETRLLGGKTLFVHEDLWPALDAYIRPLFLQIRRGALRLAALEQRIVDSLHVEGPTRADVLRGLLNLATPAQGRAFRAARRRLQALGLLVGSAAVEPGHQERIDRLALWPHRFPRRLDRKLAPYQGLAEFLRSVIHAAVHVPERTFSRWWAWPRDDVERALKVLVNGGAVLMVSVQRRNGYTTAERAEEAFRRKR